MAKIIWTDEALCWLRQIRDYISRDNPTAAQRTIDGIFARAQLLETHPTLGEFVRTSNRGDIRFTRYGHYRITYRTMGNAVEIIGIYHAALDIERYLP